MICIKTISTVRMFIAMLSTPPPPSPRLGTDLRVSLSCVTCTAGAGDDVGLPCNGLKVSLFQTGEDMCGWCPKTCLPYIEEGGKCWTTITSSQAYVSSNT